MADRNKIKCSVDSCQYWGQGNLCQADEIMVAVDSPGGDLGARMESGAQLGGARSSSATKCDTFRPK